ncbi:MAG: TOTE conflict system archaeo-eukaryotic primase domain-containing protein [Actinomycetota bacterium]
MDRLIAELQRLYFSKDQLASTAVAQTLAGGEPVALDPVGTDGRTRAMVLGFGRAADWEAAANLFRAVQEELELPAPAISVSGQNGYEVWFSLAEAVPTEDARRFLEAMRLRYLSELSASLIQLRPGDGPVGLVPALHRASGKWSAFIDPSMGSMFADEPGLEMAPSLDRQADLLSGFESIKTADFKRVRDKLLSPAAATGGAGEGAGLAVGGNFADPRSFLLAVMNDPSASPELRVEAAKALLPYFEKGGQ